MNPGMTDPHPKPPAAKALFVRLIARDGKDSEVERFLRDGLRAVIDEPETSTWYAVRFGPRDFAIFDTFPGDAGRQAHLSGQVGRALMARAAELFDVAPEIGHAEVLAFKLPGESGQVRDETSGD